MAELEDLFRAADAHALDAGNPDYAIGDLQEILRAAWRIMSPAQVRDLFVQPELIELSTLPEYQRLIQQVAKGDRHSGESWKGSDAP